MVRCLRAVAVARPGFANGPAEASVCTRYGRSPGSYLDYADLPAEEIRRPGDPCFLYTAIKKFRSAREVAQQGVFTFTNRLNASHQDVITEACDGAPYGRLVIPRDLKTDFCRRLSRMNVTAAALFPGIDGVCESIRDGLWLAVAGMEAQQSLAARP